MCYIREEVVEPFEALGVREVIFAADVVQDDYHDGVHVVCALHFAPSNNTIEQLMRNNTYKPIVAK